MANAADGAETPDAWAGRDALVGTIEAIVRELQSGAEWDNDTLPDFLEAFGALLGSIENGYRNAGRPVPSNPWQLVAESLEGARTYE